MMMRTFRLILLLGTVFGVCRADVALGACPKGWISMFNNCYLVVSNRALQFSEVSDECAKYDAVPLYIDSQAEMGNFSSIIAGSTSMAYWTGMNDLVNQNQKAPGDGVWKWSAVTYVNMSLVTWSKSPGNDGKALCGGITLGGKMYDADCNSKQGYICNIDSGTAAGGCPLGWLPTQNHCYWVSNTTDPTQLMTWQQAKQRCTALDSRAHLIVIDHLDDQIFVNYQVPYMSQTSFLHWTGLQGNGQPGGWKWYTGGPVNKALFTWAQEPDNAGGSEDCAAIRYNGKFTDRGCNQKLNYICKKFPPLSWNMYNLGCGAWKRANQKCYLFHTGSTATWTQAKQACQSQHGDLINVNDIDTKSWLTNVMMDPALMKAYWTALNDRDTEGVYKWGDGSTLDSTTINWNNEPNNFKGSEDCAVIRPGGTWNDYSCSLEKHPALCELDNVQSCPATGGTWVSRQADKGTGSNCYLFSDYKNASNLMTQSEAADFCKGLSKAAPKLYSVDSVAERDFIKTQLANYMDNPNGFWTSLNDIAAEGFYIFGTNVYSDISLVQWAGEPSTLTPDTDCARVLVGSVFQVTKCGSMNNYICERAAYGAWSSSPGLSGKSLFTTVAILVIQRIIRML